MWWIKTCDDPPHVMIHNLWQTTTCDETKLAKTPQLVMIYNLWPNTTWDVTHLVLKLIYWWKTNCEQINKTKTKEKGKKSINLKNVAIYIVSFFFSTKFSKQSFYHSKNTHKILSIFHIKLFFKTIYSSFYYEIVYKFGIREKKKKLWPTHNVT